ncbi:MAG: HEAT repeat domain-containing protein [Gemmatimonadaceae bacterium]
MRKFTADSVKYLAVLATLMAAAAPAATQVQARSKVSSTAPVAVHAMHATAGSAGAAALTLPPVGPEVVLPRGPRDAFTGGQDQTTDSLYRLAREHMNKGDYKKAAELFMRVAERSAKSPLAGDALYWNAYSLYRIGGSPELRTALQSLGRLEGEYPTSASAGDAGSLEMRVCGELARRGNEACAAQVTSSAGAASSRAASNEAARASSRSSSRSSSSASARASSRAAGASSSQAQGCPSEDDDERIAALNALLQMDSDRALPVLEKVLARRDACSAALRRKAIFLVSQKGNARAADILMNAVRTDPDVEVRQQAVFWLGQTRDERAVDMLQELLQKESSDEVLEKAVFALSQHRSPRAASILRDLATRDGASLRVREQAIFWLGQSRSAENETLLKSLYKRVAQPELKEKILFSIAQRRGTESGKWLMDVALDASETIDMRKKALFWVGQQKAVTIGELSTLYTRFTDQEMKEQIIFVFSQRNEPAAVDKLMDIARNDKDRELRKKAMFWLGQSRDQRVLKFLEDFIG